MKNNVNPRSITDAERPWIENWSDEAHRVLLIAVRERYTPRVALNVCSWVATKAIGEDPQVARTPKAQYRKILAELAEAGVSPPGRRRGVPVTPSNYPEDRPAAQGAPVEAPSGPHRLPAARRSKEAGYADIVALTGVVAGIATALAGARWPELGAFVQFAAPRIDEQQEDDGYVEQAGTGAVIVQLRPQVSGPLQRAA